jgi:eukaryotic-like serine/threonine-protein kinase
MAEAAAQASPGSLMLGRYRPLRPLGSGGSGSVWLVRDEQNGREVALKMVRREGTLGPRAEREATAAAKLRHERCLRAYALARDSGHVYIAYEYVPGRTLREAMRANELPEDALLEVAAQIAEGLAHAHCAGVVHRDVKPANVLLHEGPEIRVKLLDFGLALMREEETLTAAGDIPGTLAYISPERLRGDQAGPPADVWSVGVLLWEGLAGRHPFWNGTLVETARAIQAGPPSLAKLRPDLPKPLVDLVHRMLSTNPAKRPPAHRLATDLRRALAQRHAPRAAPARPRRAASSPFARRLPPAMAAALFAGWSSSALPFYPAHWPILLAACAFLLSLAGPRAGLTLALTVPVFPLGNYALALATLYIPVALVWLACSWRDPESGLLLALGPLLAPLGALGFLPLAVQRARGPLRRAGQACAGVLAAGAATGVTHIGRLGLAQDRGILTAAGALWRALLEHPAYPAQIVAFGLAAAALGSARARGRFAIGGLGAAVLVIVLVPTRAVAPLPVVLTTVATGALLAAEPWLRTRRVPPILRGRLVAEA